MVGTQACDLFGGRACFGVEPTNRKRLRYLKALIYDEKILSRWSHDTVFPIIKFLLNSHVLSETGMEPFPLRFEDRDNFHAVARN